MSKKVTKKAPAVGSIAKAGSERKFKNVVSAAKFWDHNAMPEYEGTYLRPVLRDADILEADQETILDGNHKGDIMGYLFVDDDGQEVIVGASHQVSRAIEQGEPGDFFQIKFLGKETNKKGRSVNRFEVNIAVDDEEVATEPDQE